MKDVKGIDFIQMLILNMLAIDDEPLNLILAEAKVTEDSKPYIKSSFNQTNVSEDDIRRGLHELITNNMVIVLDELGKKFRFSNINEVLNTVHPEQIWFRITEPGNDMFEKNYHIYWN